jgi:hypothetical protein
VDEVAALKRTRGAELRSIIWADVAKQQCKDLYICLYWLFSNDGTHTTFDAMDRYVEADAAGRIQALKLGPSRRYGRGLVGRSARGSRAFCPVVPRPAVCSNPLGKARRVFLGEIRSVALPSDDNGAPCDDDRLRGPPASQARALRGEIEEACYLHSGRR